jgi:GT2 family glycosyltransferase
LKSIISETKLDFEIIVIDNNSNDHSSEMIETEFPSVTLIKNSVNLGFAAANNQGIEIASGDFLLFLNPDTVVMDGAIDRVFEWLSARPTVGCVGCQVWESTTKIQRTCFQDPSPLNLFLIEVGMQRLAYKVGLPWNPEYSGWDRQSEREVDVVSGMFMMIPKPVIEKVGLFDEKYFIYAEEADLCRRIRGQNFKCAFTPIAKILHCDGGGKSTEQIKIKMYAQLQKSLLIYTKKFNGILGYFFVRLTYIFSSALRIIFFSILSHLNSNIQNSQRYYLAKSMFFYHLFGKEPK